MVGELFLVWKAVQCAETFSSPVKGDFLYMHHSRCNASNWWSIVLCVLEHTGIEFIPPSSAGDWVDHFPKMLVSRLSRNDGSG
jgi:hypothetical protein